MHSFLLYQALHIMQKIYKGSRVILNLKFYIFLMFDFLNKISVMHPLFVNNIKWLYEFLKKFAFTSTYICLLYSVRTRKKSLVQECRLHEPALQSQVAVQRVLQRPALLQEQSAWISCVSSSLPTATTDTSKHKLKTENKKKLEEECYFPCVILGSGIFFCALQLVWAICYPVAGRKRGSVSGLSTWCFGKRQKRWGKSFQLFFALSSSQSSGKCWVSVVVQAELL